MTAPLSPAQTLALWERGAPLHALDRAALLCAAARPDLPPQDIADLPLGTITDGLLALRVASWGARLSGHADCPRCGQRMGMDIDLAALLAEPPAARAEHSLRGQALRLPSLRDLAAVAGEPDPERAVRKLLARCLDQPECSRADPALLDEAEAALEALDPHADIALALCCPACGTAVEAQLDAGSLLWDELDARARALLREIDVLARAYGWSEGEILALGPLRRAHYLDLAAP